MISVIVCSKQNDPLKKHENHVKYMANSNIEYINVINNSGQFGLCEAYNNGVKKASGEFLVFMHDDLFLVNRGWDSVIENKFNLDNNLGAIGVAGSDYLFADDAFWLSPGAPFVHGKVIHELKDPNEVILTVFSEEDSDKEVAVVDGLIFAVRAYLFENEIRFDEETFDKFHLYDLDICMQINKKNKIIVTPDLLVKHMSGGTFNNIWKKYANLFLEKYSSRLPISITDNTPDKNNRIGINSIPIKQIVNPETYEQIKILGHFEGSPNSNVEGNFTLANRYYEQGEVDNAIDILYNILDENSNDIKTLHLLGISLFRKGEVRDAEKILHKAVTVSESDYMLLYNYGKVLIELSRFELALNFLNKSIKIKNDFIPALSLISYIFSIMGNLTLAKKTAEIIVKTEPNNPEALNNLGHIFKDTGECEKALEIFKRSINLRPKFPEAYSNLLITLHYLHDDPKLLFDAHKKLNDHLSNISINNDNFKITKKERINIGFISPDLRTHSVAYFVNPIYKFHNSKKFIFTTYNDTASIDQMTDKIRINSDRWRDIYGKSNKELGSIIKEDEIDILIDLAGHSGKNRISFFATRRAPIQITYLGYPNGTGLSTMDYRISDWHSDPKELDKYYTEKLLRLPKLFLCYEPPEVKIKKRKIPCKNNSVVTFGSFNNLSKISDHTINIWSQILAKSPSSKLLLKNRGFVDLDIQKIYKQKFISKGVKESQLIFKPYSNGILDHLECYNEIDISLDTFPYNGTTTTFESLFMGVPVITLSGQNHASSVGKSILTEMNLLDLIANSDQDFINKAMKIINNRELLFKITDNIKNSFLSSPLCNAAEFTNDFQNALEQVYLAKVDSLNE